MTGDKYQLPPEIHFGGTPYISLDEHDRRMEEAFRVAEAAERDGESMAQEISGDPVDDEVNKVVDQILGRLGIERVKDDETMSEEEVALIDRAVQDFVQRIPRKPGRTHTFTIKVQG